MTGSTAAMIPIDDGSTHSGTPMPTAAAFAKMTTAAYIAA
jgi:hypothetical protein